MSSHLKSLIALRIGESDALLDLVIPNHTHACSVGSLILVVYFYVMVMKVLMKIFRNCDYGGFSEHVRHFSRIFELYFEENN